MNNIQSNSELPSIGKLIKSTILAICIAAVILIAVVLPAEFGIDPTGIGNVMGLLRMGEIKVSLSNEAAIDSETLIENNLSVQERGQTDVNSYRRISEKGTESSKDEIIISLAPNEGKEIKLTMIKGATVNYTWYTDGGKANFDVHADSRKLEISYHNYEKGSKDRREGVLEAAFDGKHGWFWRNRTSETMTVTLKVNGEYSEIKQVK